MVFQYLESDISDVCNGEWVSLSRKRSVGSQDTWCNCINESGRNTLQMLECIEFHNCKMTSCVGTDRRLMRAVPGTEVASIPGLLHLPFLITCSANLHTASDQKWELSKTGGVEGLGTENRRCRRTGNEAIASDQTQEV